MSAPIEVEGGCHCGNVRFTATLPDRAVTLLDCNCSICAMTGFLHLIVPDTALTIDEGKQELVSYRFGSGKARHMFCRICGIKSFYRPRSHPDGWSVNFRCLDDGHGLDATIMPYDGRNWEQARVALED
jgi:hypothetical protein